MRVSAVSGLASTPARARSVTYVSLGESDLVTKVSRSEAHLGEHHGAPALPAVLKRLGFGHSLGPVRRGHLVRLASVVH
eukprot:5218977-Pyramimonas_sp.AAC.1